MSKNKYYAIRKGRKNNIVVNSWTECEELTKGYPSEYVSFTVEKDAYDWLNVNNNSLEKIAEQINNILEQNNMIIEFNMFGRVVLKHEETGEVLDL